MGHGWMDVAYSSSRFDANKSRNEPILFCIWMNNPDINQTVQFDAYEWIHFQHSNYHFWVNSSSVKKDGSDLSHSSFDIISFGWNCFRSSFIELTSLKINEFNQYGGQQIEFCGIVDDPKHLLCSNPCIRHLSHNQSESPFQRNMYRAQNSAQRDATRIMSSCRRSWRVAICSNSCTTYIVYLLRNV